MLGFNFRKTTSGVSLNRFERALALEKPSMPRGEMQASTPPHTITCTIMQLAFLSEETFEDN